MHKVTKVLGVTFAAGAVLVATSGEKSGCGGPSPITHANHVEHQHEYKEWCKHVKEGDNSTYVYYFTDHKGHSGYRRGRANAQPFVNDPNYSVKRVC